MWGSFSRKLKVNCRKTSIKNQVRTQLRLQKIILLWEMEFRTSGVLNTKMPFNRIASVHFYVENILSTVIGFSTETEPMGYICCFCPVSHSCPSLCVVYGLSRAIILEWVAINFFRGSSQSRYWTQVSCIAGRFFTVWATREELNNHANFYISILSITHIYECKSAY